MNFWCRIGLHRWDEKTDLVQHGRLTKVRTLNRCRRAGCRYRRWSVMDSYYGTKDGHEIR